MPRQFAPDDGGTLDQGAELAERTLAREVFHAAIGRRDDALGRHVLEPAADMGRHDLRRLDLRTPEIEHAEQDRLARQVAQYGEVEFRLRGLDRDLMCDALGQIGQDRIGVRLVGHDVGVAEADVDDRSALDALQCPVDRLDSEAAAILGELLHPGLVELDDVHPRRA